MNSLTYLSRQFDVLASPRAPPSTPAEERNSFLNDGGIRGLQSDGTSDTSLKRVKTWSTKSFLFPPAQQSNPARSAPKRSNSSPSDFVTLAALRPRSKTPPAPEVSVRSKSSFKCILKRILFVRVFLVFWNAVYAAWASLAHLDVAEPPDVTLEKSSESGGNDTEKEAAEGKKIVLLSSSQPPQHQSNSSFPSPQPEPSIPTIHRSDTDPIPSESKSRVDTLQTLAASSSQPTVITGAGSRSSTPPLFARKTPFHLPKTLVLDLDETLIHSTSRPIFSAGSGGGLLGLGGFGRRNKGAGHMVEVVMGERSTLYHVYKRPFVDYFLRKVSGWYTLVIFTASMQEYADPVIDWLDAGRGILDQRFFRDLPNGSYTKDLSVVEEDLARVCLVDNSPISYRINEGNGIPIEGWTHDPSDEALLDLLPVLDSLRFTSDVRRVLGIRGFS